VIVNLPENKSVIVDSKVSLIAYEKFISAEDDLQRQVSLKEHITSIRNHIKNLSSKNYQSLYQLESLDFVLMFIPIESAFSLAVQYGENLYVDAFDKGGNCKSYYFIGNFKDNCKHLEAGISNRMYLRLQDNRGLHDKFVGFIEDLIIIGNRLDQAKGTYVDAMRKISQGSGNLISRAEKIRSLGAKTTKILPQSLLDRADIINEEEETEEEIF
jgi:DNA recombination protein RmuC